MSETKNPGEKKPNVGKLTLKPRTETGVVRQSFSHGRSKMAVVEKVKRHTIGGPSETPSETRSADQLRAQPPNPVTETADSTGTLGQHIVDEMRLIAIDLPNLISSNNPNKYQENLKTFRWDRLLNELTQRGLLADDDKIDVFASARPLLGVSDPIAAEQTIKKAIPWARLNIRVRPSGDVDPIVMDAIWAFLFNNAADQMKWALRETNDRFWNDEGPRRFLEGVKRRNPETKLGLGLKPEQISPAHIKLRITLCSSDGGFAMPLAGAHYRCNASCIQLKTRIVSWEDAFSDEFRREMNRISSFRKYHDHDVDHEVILLDKLGITK